MSSPFPAWLGSTRNVLLLSLAIQLFFAPLSGHPWDTYVWLNTGERIVHGQPLYGSPGWGYPPTWAGVLGGVTLAYNPLAAWLHLPPPGYFTYPVLRARIGLSFDLGTPWVPNGLFELLVKIPIILADLGIGVLLGRVVAQRFGRPDLSTYAVTLYVLNPLVIWISSIWGMFDALPVLAMLAATLLLLDDRFLLSGILFGVAISLKYFPVVVLAALFFGLGPKLDRRWISVFLGAGAVLLALSLPFLVVNSGAYLSGIASPTDGVLQSNFSLWDILPKEHVFNIPTWVNAVDIVAVFAGIAAGATYLRLTPGWSEQPGRWVDLSILGLLVFYAIFRTINDQYLTWIIPFLTLLFVLRAEGRWPLLLITVMTLITGWISVTSYSFFLPTITLLPGAGPYVPRMVNLPIPVVVLSIGVWVVVVAYLLYFTLRVRQGAGWNPIRTLLARAVPSLA